MILDGHIHALPGPAGTQDLLRRMKAAGMGGGVVISPGPPSFGGDLAGKRPQERLESVLEWTAGNGRLYPFFWIDALEAGAGKQVARAVKAGVAGFKVICTHCPPGDRRAMKVYAAVAEAGRPMLFHAGILWNGRASSSFNRPAEFEVLLGVPRLRFALAHMGWPWCDELLAVYGKFEQARRRRPDVTVEMFIDTTPGTPPIYRRDALTKMFTVGYAVEDNIYFGADCRAQTYNAPWAREWVTRDRRILKSLGLSAATQGRYFGGNLERFILGQALA